MPESLSRRRFLQSSLAGALAGAPWGLPPGVSPADARHAVSAEKKTEVKSYPFGERRIYYNNFAEHLLNAYNPNMVYPRLRYRWTDADWRGLIDMIAGFGFNVFEFWLVPRLFSRAGIESDYGREFARQMNAVIAHAETRGVKVCLLAALTTVGDDWRTYCPNVKPEWDEVRYLWDTWTRLLPGIQLVDIFPG
ncbi:MAG TPA: twin-arginine translocation signal domain-containing protein, partial [bacterium]|nr:twin-arginine translocation signal domain-containing protein [bacterium]